MEGALAAEGVGGSWEHMDAGARRAHVLALPEPVVTGKPDLSATAEG